MSEVHLDQIRSDQQRKYELLIVSVRGIYDCNRTWWPEGTWGGGRIYFIHLTVLYHNSLLRKIRARSQGGTLEVGTEVEAIEERCLLASSDSFRLST